MVASLFLHPLSAKAFAPYGEMVSPASAQSVYPVNDGRAQRFAHLATQESLRTGLSQELSLYRVQPSTLPLEVGYFERHPLSSQLFYPLCASRYLVVVCGTLLSTGLLPLLWRVGETIKRI